MDDSGAHLALDVVADDRQGPLLETALPVGLARDEDGDAIDQRTAGRQHLLDVPLRRLFAPVRQVVHHDVRPRLL